MTQLNTALNYKTIKVYKLNHQHNTWYR